jgi:type II secretory pathway predicted ATPase ExeA
MSTIEIRAEVHQLIDQLEDEFLNAIYSMLEIYVQHEEGYGSIDNPISAEEMKNQLREEVEKGRQGQYITVDEWHEKSGERLNWLSRANSNEAFKN